MDFVPFPRFYCEKLSIWFAQVESAFTLNGIITDSDKYDYLITHIPPESATLIEDIILNPPPENRYEHIKHEFIKRMSIYHMKKVDLGSRKPSEYLRQLKEIAGQRVSNEIVLNVWLNKLPGKVREIVILERTGQIDTLCEMADKVMALVSPARPDPLIEELSGKQFDVILRRIDELSKQVQVVQLMIDGENEEDEQDTPVQQRAATSGCSHKDAFKVLHNTNGSPKVVCWYHSIFGDKAIACVSPCQYEFSPTKYFLRQ